LPPGYTPCKNNGQKAKNPMNTNKIIIMNIKQKQKVVIKNVEVIKELSVVNNLRSN
jgi:hypothetical protein